MRCKLCLSIICFFFLKEDQLQFVEKILYQLFLVFMSLHHYHLLIVTITEAGAEDLRATVPASSYSNFLRHSNYLPSIVATAKQPISISQSGAYAYNF